MSARRGKCVVLTTAATIGAILAIVSGCFFWSQYRVYSEVQREALMYEASATTSDVVARQSEWTEKNNHIGRQIADLQATLNELQNERFPSEFQDQKRIQLKLLDLAAHRGLQVEEASVMEKKADARTDGGGDADAFQRAFRLKSRATFRAAMSFLDGVAKIRGPLTPILFELERQDVRRVEVLRDERTVRGTAEAASCEERLRFDVTVGF